MQKNKSEYIGLQDSPNKLLAARYLADLLNTPFINRNAVFIEILEEIFNRFLLDNNLELLVKYEVYDESQVKSGSYCAGMYHFINKKLGTTLTAEKYINNNIITYSSIILYNQKSADSKVEEYKQFLINNIYKKVVKDETEVSYITKNAYGLSLSTISIKIDEKIDFDLNYNEDFNYDKINKCISENKSGLILLGGDPGTGKSTFIRYIKRSTNRKMVFIPSYMLSTLESPEFMDFTLGRLKDCILVIEDCEKILLDRKNSGNAAISTILNMSSGTLGLSTNITIIATYNTSERLDSALFRKGRLLYQYVFKALTTDRANALAKSINREIYFTEPTILADVLIEEENNKQSQVIKSVGFNLS